ncbi:MAG: hypothetical protein ACJ8EQ_05580 [Sphingomicrobium sp.]
MTARSWKFGAWKFGAAAAAAILAIAGCRSTEAPPAPTSAGAGTTGGTTAGGTGTGTGTSVPNLVNVNLQNVLNNLSVALKISNANIPVNAQVPIDVAANVCGVSVSALAASIASGQAGCTATTTSPSLVQYVQQQISAGGGSQTTGSTTSNMM